MSTRNKNHIGPLDHINIQKDLDDFLSAIIDYADLHELYNIESTAMKLRLNLSKVLDFYIGE